MQDWIIDDDRLSIERKSLLPGEGFFHPESVEAEQQRQEVAETLSGAETVVVADPDADGLAATALIRIARGAGVLVPASPHDLDERLAWTAEFLEADATVFVCDLCPDSEADLAALSTLTTRAGDVRWFDHHQWDPDLAEQVRNAGIDLTVGASEEVCTADVALEQLDHAFADRYRELVVVTRDHDLWLQEDPRSDDLADYAYWVDPEEYLETITEYGADFPPAVETFLEEQRVEKDALIQKAVQRAQLREVGPWTVGVTYGRCSQNEVAEALREQGADATVIVKPAGSASLRGTDNFERCHEVARQVNGGGHPKAAGCKPDVYDDMLDYAHHWTTQGAVAKQAIIDGFRRLEWEEDERDGDEEAVEDETGGDEEAVEDGTGSDEEAVEDET